MTSKRETIMAYIAQRLATITTANGYNTDVADVQRWITAPETSEADFSGFPLVVVEEGAETIDYEPARTAMSTISFRILAFLSGTTTVTPTVLNAFIEDVRKLIEAEHRANGEAVDAVVTSVDIQHAADVPYAAAALTVETKYYHEVSRP